MSEHETPQQLSLLPRADVPVRFRLDEATRRRGLQHVAEIRQQLAERRAIRAEQQAATARRPAARRAA